MKRSPLLASIAIGTGLLGLGHPAVAQTDAECLRELAEIESAHLGVLEHMSAFELRSLSALRDAAQVLVRNDKEDACEELVEAVGEILEERREELVDAGLMVEIGDEERLARLENAPLVDQLVAPLRAGNLIGSTLRNTQDEDLGEISDVVFDPDGRTMTHALVEVGGFLGLGEEIVAVPLDVMRVTEDMSTFVLDMSKARFEEAPRVERDQLQQVDDLDWREQNDMYYALSEQ